MTFFALVYSMCLLLHLYEDILCKYLESLFFNICVSFSILIYSANTDKFKKSAT